MAHRPIRNAELAVVQRNDPARLRSRTVETEPRKRRAVRSRRKEGWRREEGRA
jgi:hypothetical protein